MRTETVTVWEDVSDDDEVEVKAKSSAGTKTAETAASAAAAAPKSKGKGSIKTGKSNGPKKQAGLASFFAKKK